MRSFWHSFASPLLVLTAVEGHRIADRMGRLSLEPSRAVNSRPLRPLLLLRGGADDVLPEPAAAVPTKQAEADPPLQMKGASPPVTCWSAVCKLAKSLQSMLSPTYE